VRERKGKRRIKEREIRNEFTDRLLGEVVSGTMLWTLLPFFEWFDLIL